MTKMASWPAVLLGCLIFSGMVAEAGSPSMTSVRPVGGRRGGEVVVNLGGARLADAEEVLFYRPGISATKLEVVNPNLVRVTFRIDPDCRLGLHDFRLRTRSGVSELRTFSVGALPEVAEKEPNNDFAQPQAIPLNTTVTGVAQREDVDFFRVSAKKGQRITAEVEGIRIGITLFDPYVAIRDANRFDLAASDDLAAVWQDGIASIVAPEDGDYIIEVRDSAYAGDGNSLYRLHIGEFPRPRAVYPSGGKPGDQVQVRWIGDVEGDRQTTVDLPAMVDREFGLVAQDERGVAPYALPFRLSPLENVMEAEPNDRPDAANPALVPAAINGIIEQDEDVDCFVFSAKKGESFHVRSYARSLRSPLDPVVSIAKKGERKPIASNDDFGGAPDSYIRFNVPSDGEYVVTVRDHLRKGGPDYVYRVEFEPVSPKLEVFPTAEQLRRGTGSVAVAVPRGNRQSMLIYARRLDFGGVLGVSVPDLPAGVRAISDPMVEAVNVVPVVFEAAPDAPLAGALATVAARKEGDKSEIGSSFSASATLVYGQNNRVFWERVVDRVPVAVTEEVPFAIEVVEPKAPLVQSGAMELKVRAIRQPGYDKELTLIVPWTPPGVSAQRGVKIKKGEDEATIPLNANGNAPSRDWKIVVDAVGPTDKGPVKVSSQLARLFIRPRMLAFKYQPVSVEQGQKVDFPVDVQVLEAFEGEAKVELMGLPAKVSAPTLSLTNKGEGLVFPLQIDPASPAGTHKNVFCKVTVMRDGEPVVHNLGAGTLRIDKPLPDKGKVAAAKPAGPAEASKPLSRLEKLRAELKAKREAESGTNR